MIRKLKKEEFALAVEIDKGLKNKWSPLWLEATVKTTLVLPKGKKEVELRVGDSISKVNVAGKAICDFCQDTIKYASRGKACLINHLTTEKHLKHVKTRLTNESLGSFGKSVNLNSSSSLC